MQDVVTGFKLIHDHSLRSEILKDFGNLDQELIF